MTAVERIVGFILLVSILPSSIPRPLTKRTWISWWRRWGRRRAGRRSESGRTLQPTPDPTHCLSDAKGFDSFWTGGSGV